MAFLILTLAVLLAPCITALLVLFQIMRMLARAMVTLALLALIG
ncbi:MAG: hypothetical protein Q4B91_07220 [Atopobiaceae bacterium]|nr:hypothetical protein [Atopobiaceae bacterium]